ncbi:MAG: alanine racemase [Armatimonadota bacterium]
MRPSFLEIDLAAVRGNLREIQRVVGADTAVAAIVKAGAYGHGGVEVARAALQAGAKMLCVAIVSEGIELREAGLDGPILGLGPPDRAEIDGAVAYDLTLSVGERIHATIVADAARRAGRRASVHVKLDTGMGRHGARPDVARSLADTLAAMPEVEVTGVFTHFAEAPDPEWTAHQFEQFETVSREFGAGEPGGPIRHACNSVALLRLPEARLEMVRPGAILYGFNPGCDPALIPAAIRPVMSLRSTVSLVKTVEAGEPVGYGLTWHAPRDSRIAVLPLGYADGYPRALSNNADVLIGGRRCPLVGRVSMDALTVDVTDAGPVEIGDEVVLIGAQGDERITVDEIAERAGTIGQEIVSRLSPRLPRVYLNGSDG